MKYDIPIESPEHAEFCKQEAERRYDGKCVRETEYGMLVVEGNDGYTHTDAVLRALSFYEEETCPNCGHVIRPARRE